ncbi:MAG TPA: GT4 family glycosyltransferase PelF [Polyangiales bacterium]|nr:GT4 family glycosyltransferase PelF [Polyangiales bacterium]
MQAADICLLLEGTYPYVRGGVSAWLHQLVRSLHELTFALVFLGGRRMDYGEPQYALPPNVVHLEAHYLEDALRECPPHRTRLSGRRVREVCALHAELESLARAAQAPADPQKPPQAPPSSGALDEVLRELGRDRGLRLAQFLYSSGAWEILCNAYVTRARESSFLDYFWTLRLMHAPLFQLARIADQVPPARVYHSISTGYAGFLGAVLQSRRERPFILSEHGIYTKERRIDLNQTEWFEPTRGEFEPGLGEPRAELRELWIRYFESLGRIAYRSADPIVALSEGNRQRQIADGAPAERVRIVSNGIDVAAFESALLARPAELPLVVGLIGRVVPIKDVKTFIRAMGAVVAEIPSAQGWVIGGADEEPAYARECVALVGALRLNASVKFLGHQRTAEVLPKLGVVMLTSVSEGQPLVLLEAFAAGVPCVATDVGGCRELIEGRDPDDQALGRAGRIAPFADSDALARAAIELLSSADEWQACQVSGLRRVRRCYEQQSMVDAYRDCYRAALDKP